MDPRQASDGSDRAAPEPDPAAEPTDAGEAGGGDDDAGDAVVRDEDAAPAPAAAEPDDRPERQPDSDGFEHRHRDALRLELALGGAVVGGLGLGALLIGAALVAATPLSAWFMLVALAVPLLLTFPLLVVPRWRHRHYLYRVDDRGLELRKGIWWRSHRFIPHTRLQHTDIAQGPLERKFGLANLIVHTAGTHEARTTVHGLSLETARGLRRRLTAETGAEDGDDDGV